MSSFREKFDIANGTTITTSNSNYTTTNSGSTTATANTANALVGTACAACVCAAQSISLSHAFTGATTKHFRRIYYKPTGNPSATTSIIRFLDASDALCFEVQFMTTGVLRLRNSAGAQIAVTSTTLTANSYCRIEVSGNAGTATLKLYTGSNLHTGVATEVISGAYATTAISKVQVGATVSTTLTAYIDDDRGSDTDWIGPDASLAAQLTVSATGTTGWTPTGGANGTVVTSDTDDATYIESSSSPSSLVLDFTLPPIATPGGDLFFYTRMYLQSASSGTVTPTLRDGTTTVATGVAMAPPSAVDDVAFRFDAADIAGVAGSKWSAGTLVVRLSVTAS